MITITEPSSVFLTVQIGVIHTEEGQEYEVVQIGGVKPAIRSKQSGRHAIFEWKEMLAAALNQGLDSP